MRRCVRVCVCDGVFDVAFVGAAGQPRTRVVISGGGTVAHVAASYDTMVDADVVVDDGGVLESTASGRELVLLGGLETRSGSLTRVRGGGVIRRDAGIRLGGGLLVGVGEIAASTLWNDAGRVMAGDPVGVLVLSGNLQQGPSGVVIGTITQGAAGQLSVTGADNDVGGTIETNIYNLCPLETTTELTVVALPSGWTDAGLAFDDGGTGVLLNLEPTLMSFTVTGETCNEAPEVIGSIPAQVALEDELWFFPFDVNAVFNDTDDVLSLSAALTSGGPLPTWLIFYPTLPAFLAERPGDADVGLYEVTVFAADEYRVISTRFNLTVLDVNDVPQVNGSVAAANASVNQLFTLVLPSGLFRDAESGWDLAWTAALNAGLPLPQWLVFNATTRVLAGTPGVDDVGALVVVITASDGAGASASVSFLLTVEACGASAVFDACGVCNGDNSTCGCDGVSLSGMVWDPLCPLDCVPTAASATLTPQSATAMQVSSSWPPGVVVAALGTANPTLSLREGVRYTLASPPSHPLALAALGASAAVDVLLLVQGPAAGSLEGDAGIAWDDQGDAVAFTVTATLRAALTTLFAATHAPGWRVNSLPGVMRGAVVVQEPLLGSGFCLDCSGTPYGVLEADVCGVCNGTNSTCLSGCDERPLSTRAYDACGVCGGDNSTCAGCDGVPNSGLVLDACSVCGGGATVCQEDDPSDPSGSGADGAVDGASSSSSSSSSSTVNAMSAGAGALAMLVVVAVIVLVWRIAARTRGEPKFQEAGEQLFPTTTQQLVTAAGGEFTTEGSTAVGGGGGFDDDGTVLFTDTGAETVGSIGDDFSVELGDGTAATLAHDGAGSTLLSTDDAPSLV